MRLTLTLGFMLSCGVALSQPEVPKLDLGALPEADSKPTMVGRVLRTGVHRGLPRQVDQAGAWTTDPDGSRVYRLTLRSPGAEGLRLEFSAVDLGAGELAVYSASQKGPQEFERYRGRGPHDDGQFWSHTIFGEELTLEYRPAPGDSSRAVPFRLGQLSHRLRDPQAAKAATDFGEAEGCHLDPNCHPEWLESGRSVAMYYFETPGGQSACSGALVRTRANSGIPYFLTADHCISDEAMARTVEAFFNFQTSTCNAKTASLNDAQRATPIGARYVVSRDASIGDFSLIVLNGIPSSARFADWDFNDPPVGAPLVGIHHPRATRKRISFGQMFVNYWDFGGSQFPSQLYHQVRWNGGATEGGSSGSPLFSRPNTITGMLSYGPYFSDTTICEQNPRVDGYAKFSLAWPFFQPYLDDPIPTNLTVAPATPAEFAVRNGAVTGAARQALVLSSTSTEALPVSVRTSEEWIQVTPSNGQIRAGQALTIQVSPRLNYLTRAGRYTGSIEITQGRNLRTVPVTVNVTIAPSNVTLRATPNPVRAAEPDAQGCRYRFSLEIEERGGTATRFTSLRVNGEDLTSQLNAWFGTMEITAQGRLRTEVKVCSPGAPLPYQIQLSGADPGAGQNWTRSTLVEFLP